MCAQLDAYLAEARGYGIDRAGVHLVYLKGAIRRELAWHDDMGHYLEDLTLANLVPDWRPLLALVE